MQIDIIFLRMAWLCRCTVSKYVSDICMLVGWPLPRWMICGFDNMAAWEPFFHQCIAMDIPKLSQLGLLLYWVCTACPIQWRQDRGGERIPSQEKDFEFLKSFQCFSSPLTSFVQPCQNWQKGWVNRVLVSQSFSDLISIISLRYVSKKYWLSNGALKSAHLK